jgi:hypothetical protein
MPHYVEKASANSRNLVNQVRKKSKHFRISQLFMVVMMMIAMINILLILRFRGDQ